MAQPLVGSKHCLLIHDLNNGLGVIAGHCQLLSENLQASEECKRRLRHILQTVERLATRINGHDCQMSSCVLGESPLLGRELAELDKLRHAIK